ncbi:MAG: condensation domain-containing protein [Candidatus Acidiferrales bacterium]
MLERSDATTRCAASFSQQSLWLLRQFDPLSSAYNLQIGLRLKGPLHYDALKSSLQEIVNRHDVLRTKFALEEDQLLQIVVPHYTVSLPVVDLSSLEESARQVAAYQSAWEETQQRFDLSQEPLFRFKLVRLASNDHVLNCVMDHIVSDGWSLGIWVRELTSLYTACSNGQGSPLAPLPIQYRDYAQWQRESIAGELFETQVGYWKRKLDGAPALLELRTGRVRPQQQTFAGSSQWLPISADVIRGLKSLSAKHDATLFMVAFAAFQWLLSRYSGREDILVGVPVAGRNRWETEELIGMFVNTVVIRTDLAGNPRFRDLVKRVRAVAIEGFCNSDLPFATLVEELHPVRNASYNPIFQVMFAVIKSAVQSNVFGALHVTPYVVASGTSNLDLTVNLIECANEQWLVQIDYNSSLFDNGMMTGLLEDYVSSLQVVLSQPDTRLSDLERYFDKNTTHIRSIGR